MQITNFSSGELSKTLKGRIDLPQYYQGAANIKNFEVIPTGGIKRRSGFMRCGKLHGEGRLIPFILDKDNSFILEFTPGTLYFWKNGEPFLDTDNLQITLPIPYTSVAELNEIQYAQNYDTLIFVQRNHTPQMLQYDFALQTFTIASMEFDFYSDVNLDDDFGYVVIADEALPVAEFDGQYCIFNGHLWKYSEADQEWQIDGEEPDTDYDLFTTENKYPGCVAFFNGRLFLGSTKEARQKVWASATPDTKGTRYNNFCTYQKYVTVNKMIKEPDLHLFTGDIKTINIDVVANETVIINVSQDFTGDGALEKDATEYYVYNSNYIPLGTKVKSISASTIVLDGAISLTEDIKRIVFQMALWKNPESASADDYEFQLVNNNLTTADCSFNLELASDQNDAVLFMSANQSLIVGTESSIWYVPGTVNALSVAAVFNGSYGSDEIQGHCVGNATVYFAQGKCGIREHYYNPQAEGFETNNIAILAEHMLTESPAVDFDFMTNPYNRILVTREDGNIASMLYDKTNGVMAWTHIEHGEAKIDSIAVTRGNRDADYIYAAVKDGNEYFLEKLDAGQRVFLDSWQLYDAEGDYSDYSENAVLYNATSKKEIPLSELENNADFIAENDVVYVGYSFESVILSMPVIAGDPQAKKRIATLYVRFTDSFMPVMEIGNLKEYFTSETEPYSGIKQITYPGQSERDVDFKISIKKPEECCILSVNAILA